MKLTEYLKETQSEMKHVSWPTRKQSVTYAVVVIVIALAIGLLLGLFDYIFSHLLQQIL